MTMVRKDAVCPVCNRLVVLGAFQLEKSPFFMRAHPSGNVPIAVNKEDWLSKFLETSHMICGGSGFQVKPTN